MIKGIRKSFKEKTSSSSISSPQSITDRHPSISSKSELHITTNNLLQSPKKVIKALYDYKPQGPGELEFNRGDFFHVIGNENDPEWYEACNPSKNLRGMVPVPYFEVFGKTQANRDSNARSSPSSKKLSTDSMPISSRTTTRSSDSRTLYAVVLYEFKAERPDELDVNIGENIILCAHHNYEWFIAKPIDRLGGPGLVPVSFVNIINITTGNFTGNEVADDINTANLPTVEEWKSKNAKYKANSIPLGNVEENSYNNNVNRKSSMNGTQSQQWNHEYEIAVDNTRPYIIDASVDSFHIDNGRYVFHVRAELDDGEVRSLGRYYEDFYDFQIKLLEFFPAQAGRASSQGSHHSAGGTNKRILPFIPGPLTYVTDKITMKRQADLNDYVQELISLPEFISHSNYVKSLFNFKHEMDHEIDASSEESIKFVQQRNNTAIPTLYNDEDEHNNTIVKDESVKTLNAQDSNTLTNQNFQGSLTGISNQKLKFYYKDDIFALLINSNISFEELKTKISRKIYDEGEEKEFKMFAKTPEGLGDEVVNFDGIAEIVKNKLKVAIEDE